MNRSSICSYITLKAKCIFSFLLIAYSAILSPLGIGISSIGTRILSACLLSFFGFGSGLNPQLGHSASDLSYRNPHSVHSVTLVGCSFLALSFPIPLKNIFSQSRVGSDHF